MNKEEQKQKDKEEAVLLALQKDMALIRKNLEVYGMKKDGTLILISESNNHDDLWKDALNILNK